VRRRSTASRKSGETQHRKPTRPKRGNAPPASRRRSPTVANLQEQVAFLTRELSEALEQQTATSEVLRVISSSSGDLEPVFKAMLANAVRICEARFGLLYRIKNGTARIISKLGIPPAFEAYLRRGLHRPPLNRLHPLNCGQPSPAGLFFYAIGVSHSTISG
jgi:hypothetical protein